METQSIVERLRAEASYYDEEASDHSTSRVCTEAADHIERLEREVAHWKANHDSQLSKKRAVHEMLERAKRAAAIGRVVCKFSRI